MNELLMNLDQRRALIHIYSVTCSTEGCRCYATLVKLQLGFNPVAVVQQYNRQVTHITHKQSTNTIQKHNNK
jgi:hypothetical protein